MAAGDVGDLFGVNEQALNCRASRAIKSCSRYSGSWVSRES